MDFLENEAEAFQRLDCQGFQALNQHFFGGYKTRKTSRKIKILSQLQKHGKTPIYKEKALNQLNVVPKSTANAS